MTDVATRYEKKIIASILLLAFALRVWGLHFGLPGLFHADEPIVLNHALAYGTGDFNPHFFKIPPLVSYLLFAVFGLYYLAGSLGGLFTGTADFENFFYTDPSSFYLLARLIFGALAGTLTVLAFYRAVKRHFDAARGLTAAFLLAVCFLHVTDSHYLYADIPLLLVIVFAFGIFWDIHSDSGFLKHIASGAVIGLAIALKYNGIFIGLFYGAMLLGASMRLSQKIKYGLSVAGAAGVIFTFLNPYWLLDFNFFFAELKKQSLSQGGVGWLHHGVYSLPGAVGLPVLLAALAGCFTVLQMKQPADAQLKRLALFVFTVGYYTVLACSGQPYPRYVLPLLPGLLFFAADFLCYLTGKNCSRWFFSAGFLFLAAFPLTKSVLWDRLMSAPDVRMQAKVWIESNLASGTSMALDWEFYMPRLNFTPEQLEAKQSELQRTNYFQAAQIRRLEILKNRSAHELVYSLHFLVPKPLEQERFLMATPAVPYDLEKLKSLGIQYALLIPGIQPREAFSFYDQIQREGRLIQSFSPYRNGRIKPLDAITMTGGPFTWSEIVHRARNGHTIWIYQIL